MSKKAKVIDKGHLKYFISEHYNFRFDRLNGDMVRWGKTLDDDPDESPFGPEILDIEISEGECSGRCSFCYKDNGDTQGQVHNMTLEQFQNILDKMPPTLTQIAFGICDVDTNPDFIPMMEYSMSKGIIPNFTCNGKRVTAEFANNVSQLCGACAVSIVNKEDSYNSIKMFTDAGMDQVNIHFMLSEQTYDRALKLVDDIASDPRLQRMRAVVFLQYKHKNPKSNFTSMLDKEKYLKLVNYCEEKKVAFGFDSCSANLFVESVKDEPLANLYTMISEPCESTCFSSYINCRGEFSPCSFCENMKFGDHDWSKGLDVLKAESFLDIWHHPDVVKFREMLINNGRNCPIYKI